jgi:hypothetical protein
MARRKQRTIAAHPGEILRTEFMEPMEITAYQLAKALHLPGIYEIVREQRGHQRRRCSPPWQILWHDTAVLDESASRLRPAACSGQGTTEQDQAALRRVARRYFPLTRTKRELVRHRGVAAFLHSEPRSYDRSRRVSIFGTSQGRRDPVRPSVLATKNSALERWSPSVGTEY